MLPKFSVKKPFTVLVCVVLVIILGVVSFLNMTPDLLPNMDFPYVMVMTAYPGASPEEVEEIVTKPVEQAMATLDNLKSLSSTSSENYSIVMLEFSDSANMDTITIDIREQLDMLSSAWDDVIGVPYMLKINPNMLPVTVAAINVEGMDTAGLTELLNNTLMNELEGVEGVANISVSGDVQKQISIVLNQGKIDAVNEKIESAVNAQYGSAKTQLEGAINTALNSRGQIASGQLALDSGYSAMLDQLSSARQGLDSGKDQLFNTQLTLYASRSEIVSQINAATANKTTLTNYSNSYNALNASLTQLTAKKTELEGLAADIPSLRSRSEALISAAMSSQSLGRDGAIAYLEANSAEYRDVTDRLNTKLARLSELGLTESTLAAAISDAALQITQTQSSIASITNALSLLGLTPLTLDSAIQQADASLSSLNALLARTDQMIAQTGSSSVSVEEALRALDRQEAEATYKLYKNTAELIASDKTLALSIINMQSSLAEIDSARKDSLSSFDVSGALNMGNISKIITAQNFSMPAGYITENGTDYLVRVGDKFTDTSQVEGMLLIDLGVPGIEPIYISDVADVSLTDNSSQIYAKVGDNDGILLSFTKQSNYATATVSANIAAKLTQLSEKYPGLTYTNMMDQGVYIRMIVNSVLENLLIGAVLAIAILYIFLKDIRPTFIIACSIPISVTFAIVLMYFSNISLNMISLAGLAVGIGMLVDNSIVVIENIYRLRSLGVPVLKAAVSGAAQVAGAITASTLTTVCVFAPIVFVQGITRQLFTDMALTIAYSLLASLIVALTLVPAISSGVLKKTSEKKSKLFEKLLIIYEKYLKISLDKKKLVLIGAAVLLALSFVLTVVRGFTFMPAMSSTEISVNLEMNAGATLEETAAMSDEVIKRISSLEEVDTVGAMLSGGMASTVGLGDLSSGSTDSVTMYVILKEQYASKSLKISDEIEGMLSDLDCKITVSGASSMMDYSVLGGSGVSINIYGNDLDALQKAASEIADITAGVEGIKEVKSGVEDTTPVIKITVDKNKAAEHSLTVAQVYMAVSQAITSSTTAATLSVTEGTYDINITDEKAAGTSLADIENFVVTAASAAGEDISVNLKDIAEISMGESLNSISRSEQRRFITVSAVLEDGYNVTKVNTAVENALKGYALPDGCTIEFGGENETIINSLTDLLLMLLLGIVIVYLIMVAQFQSLLSPFIVMFTIPLAFTGGLIALLITGFEISVVSMIGFVMLVGIIVNNGIVLIDYINQLRAEGADKRAAITEACMTRLRPVIMTALTTVLGLLPMALGIGMGADLMQPVAIVCIGGLVYATFMTLFVVPAMYDLMMKKEVRVVTQDDLTIADI